MKSKKIITILLSLAIMVTFMPLMAFADTYPAGDVASWGTSDKYATMTDTNNHPFTAKYYFGSYAQNAENWNTQNWDGVVVARVSNDNTSVVGDVWTAPQDNARFFYDFDGSAFVNGSTALDGKNVSGGTWYNGSMTLGIQLVAQNYANYANYSTTSAAKNTVDLISRGYNATTKLATWDATLGGWTIKVVAEGYDSTKASEDQTVKIYVDSVEAANAQDGTRNKPQRVGAMPTATITVKGTPETVNSAEYYLDTVGTTLASDGVFYDGAAHKVVATPVDGYTVSYKVYDKTKGDYVATDAVEVTNVGEVNFIAVWKKTSTGVTSETRSKIAKINPVSGPSVGFDSTQSVSDTACNYHVVGTEYNALDFLTIVPFNDPNKKTTTAAENARIAENAASEAAVAANKSELANYFADFYEVKATELKSDSEGADVKLEIKAKTLTSTERTALEKKYETLMKNFGVSSGSTLGTARYTTAKVWLNSEKVDEEIEFTKAPSTKVYHVKKAKGLKKAKSFTVKAKSNKGRTVSYKLINADTKIKINKTTGKITLKKGLAKGTYKFYVKAYVPGRDIYETQFITVKIKK
jgi:hypothetical protein